MKKTGRKRIPAGMSFFRASRTASVEYRSSASNQSRRSEDTAGEEERLAHLDRVAGPVFPPQSQRPLNSPLSSVHRLRLLTSLGEVPKARRSEFGGEEQSSADQAIKIRARRRRGWRALRVRWTEQRGPYVSRVNRKRARAVCKRRKKSPSTLRRPLRRVRRTRASPD
jgi:hypothetical protein